MHDYNLIMNRVICGIIVDLVSKLVPEGRLTEERIRITKITAMQMLDYSTKSINDIDGSAPKW